MASPKASSIWGYIEQSSFAATVDIPRYHREVADRIDGIAEGIVDMRLK
jgi:hypothetical protein